MRGGQKRGQLFGDTGVVLRVTPGGLMGAFSVGITRIDWHDAPGNRYDGVY